MPPSQAPFIIAVKAAKGLSMLRERPAGTSAQETGGTRGVLARLLSRVGLGHLFRSARASESAAFTTAFVSLAAKMAKADGVAVLAERQAFEHFLEVTPEDAANIRRLYDLAKTNTAGYESYAERIGRMLVDEPDVKTSVLECLLYVACSDGILHPAEDEFLSVVAEKFSIPASEFRRIRSLFVRDAGNPYEVLGVAADATLVEIKARYRELVVQCHPDKLMASGAKAAILKAATAKVAAINGAYETILKERSGGREQ